MSNAIKTLNNSIMFHIIKRHLNTASKSKQSFFKEKWKKRKEPQLKPGVQPIFDYQKSSLDNRVYVWGLAEHGALGIIEKVVHVEGTRYISHPRRTYYGENLRITDIACGYGFSAFAVNSPDGEIVYGSGINTDSQIGFYPRDRRYKDHVITNPRPIPLPLQELKSAQVLDLAAGRAHLLVLTNEGLYTLGNNGYGQCGRPIVNNENYIQSTVVHHIPDIKGHKITSVTAGQDHSMLLTEKGEVYTFGWGADGQTGLAHYHNEYRPGLVKGDLSGERITKISCVADCVLALSDKGDVFGWGNSEYQQLTTKDDKCQLNIATEVEQCRGLGRIVDIAAGGTFCMVLNDEGQVFVWGYGVLGLGPQVQHVLKPTQIPPTLFGYNLYQTDTKVQSICCGTSHLGAVTNHGYLYMWGHNKFGSLGLGNLKNQYFPLKVSISAQVKKVACGVDHTLTLCKPFI